MPGDTQTCNHAFTEPDKPILGISIIILQLASISPGASRVSMALRWFVNGRKVYRSEILGGWQTAQGEGADHLLEAEQQVFAPDHRSASDGKDLRVEVGLH